MVLLRLNLDLSEEICCEFLTHLFGVWDDLLLVGAHNDLNAFVELLKFDLIDNLDVLLNELRESLRKSIFHFIDLKKVSDGQANVDTQRKSLVAVEHVIQFPNHKNQVLLVLELQVAEFPQALSSAGD